MLDLVRISLLNALRGHVSPISFAVVSLDVSKQFRTFANNLGFDLLPYTLAEILAYLSRIRERPDRSQTITASVSMYKACIAQLLYRVKNGWFLGGESLGNNYDLAIKLFATLNRDFTKLGENKGADLCQESIDYISNYQGDVVRLIHGWTEFYSECSTIT